MPIKRSDILFYLQDVYLLSIRKACNLFFQDHRTHCQIHSVKYTKHKKPKSTITKLNNLFAINAPNPSIYKLLRYSSVSASGTFTAEEKLKVVMAVIQDVKAVSDVAKENIIHPNMILN